MTDITNLKDLSERVKNTMGVSVNNPRRIARVIDALRVFCYIGKYKLDYEERLIADEIGRNHSTVNHHARRASELIEFDSEFRSMYEKVLLGIKVPDKSGRLYRIYLKHKRLAEKYKEQLELP